MVKPLYLAFKDEPETMLCFLVFHDVREALRKMQNLVVDQGVLNIKPSHNH